MVGKRWVIVCTPILSPFTEASQDSGADVIDLTLSDSDNE